MLLVDDMPYFALFVMRNMVDRLRRMNEQWLSISTGALSRLFTPITRSQPVG